MKKVLIFLAVLIAVFLLSACGGSADPFEANGDGSKSTPAPQSPSCAASACL